jgi:hypothetical protein
MGLNCSYGSGDGYGYGDGDGYGYGYGDGSGSGDGYGDGSGSGDGSGYGYGYGDGSGSGDGSGDGYCSGDGNGDGSGYGYGSGSGEISLPEESPFTAYHFIRKNLDGCYNMRNGETVTTGQVVKEETTKLCESGLHASFCKRDAEKYRPENSVLTEVHVWGRVIMGRDKLVATHRKIIREIPE